MENFKRGDEVVLKSGGPVMDIERIMVHDGENVCICSWNNKDGVRVSDGFKPEMLEYA